MRASLRLATLALSVLVPVATASAGTVVSLESPGVYGLDSVGFELQREVRVDIEAVGIAQADATGQRQWSWVSKRDGEPFLVYAWLLDSRTREPVWTMDHRDAERAGDGLRRVQETVAIGPGRYELYLFSRLGRLADAPADDRDDSWWERFLEGRRMSGDELREALDACLVRLSAPGLAPDDIRRFDVDGGLPEALVRLHRMGDSQFATGGFALDRRSELRIYALIERSEKLGPAADYGWIVNEATREIVWNATDASDEPAGGARKNRRIDSRVTLEPGRYLVYYGTDDTHSFETFNTAAPRDPFNWGLTILPGDDFRSDAFRTFEPDSPAPLLELTRAGDNRMLEQAFRLERGGAFHVHALGEYGEDGTFYDRGWIVDAASGDVAWEMTRRNTMPGGGAEKNRMFDGLVELSAGEYVVYYVSDGSHSFDGWNAGTPFEPERWGVTLRPGPRFAARDFRQVDAGELAPAKGLLAQIVRVGDDERRQELFRVERQTRVRIYGVGEGRGGDLYDRGLLLDSSGRTVWEMSRDNTRHAGGAEKNVVADVELTLAPGEYVAVYESDGSHSFAGWNAAPPRDPLHWGLTIRSLEP